MTTETNETNETTEPTRIAPWRREMRIFLVVALLGAVVFGVGATAEMLLHNDVMSVALWLCATIYAAGAGSASAQLPRRRDRR